MQATIGTTQKSRFKLSPQDAEEIRRNPPEILTVPETSAFSTISVRKIWDLIGAGKLKAARIGSRTVIRKKNLDAFLDSRTA